MKTKNLIYLILISISIIKAEPWLGNLPKANQYLCGDSRGRILRVAFRSSQRQKDFKTESFNFKKAYAVKNFFSPSKKGEQILRIYKGNETKHDWTEEVTQDFEIILSINPFLAGIKEIINFKIIGKKSFEPFKACVVIKGELPYGIKDALYELTSSKSLTTYCNLKTFGGQWIVKFNWEKFGYIFFSILKILFNLTSLIVIFIKPLLSTERKILMTWIGQTIILFQLLMYSPLTTGLFGGVIDEFHKGIIRASKEFIFLKIQPNFNKESLDYSLGFDIYKFYDNEIYAALTEELFIGTFGLLLALILSGIVILTKNKKLKKMIFETRRTIGILFFIPFSVFVFYVLFMYSITSTFTYLWCVINTILIIIFLLFYSSEIVKMIILIDDDEYLKKKGVYKGKVRFVRENGYEWAFETYASERNISWILALEIFLYFLSAVSYVVTYEWGKYAPFAILFCWIFLSFYFGFKIKKFSIRNEEMKKSKIVMKLTLLICLFRCGEFLILGLINGNKFNLKKIEVFTVIYMILFFVDIFLIIFQLCLRIWNLTFEDRKIKKIRLSDDEEKRRK